MEGWTIGKRACGYGWLRAYRVAEGAEEAVAVAIGADQVQAMHLLQLPLDLSEPAPAMRRHRGGHV